MEVKDIIRTYREKLNLTMKQLANRVGVSEGTISRWESGKIENMRRDKIEKLANALHVSPGYLMGWDSNVESKQIDRKTVKVPVLGRVAAGVPIDAIEEIVDWEEIPESMARGGSYYGLQIKGHSMEPTIKDGDTVIFRQQPDAESGEIVIALINSNEATCKRLKKYDDSIALISINPAFEPMVFTADQIADLPVKIIGKVVELIRKF